MSNEKYKESVKKLLIFIFVAFGTFILFLQLITEISRYSRKETITGRSVSQEDVPIPSLITCWPTELYLQKHKYITTRNIPKELFKAIPEEADSWNDFPYKDHGLKFIYDSVVVYPTSAISECKIGESYSCMAEQGASHKWINFLKRTESCSILTTTFKVPYGQAVTVFVKYTHDWNGVLKAQDARYSFSQYTKKHESPLKLYLRNTTVTFEKYTTVKENEQSCSMDEDIVECEVDCIERYLLEGASACVMPWMTSSGEECSNASSAVGMIKKEAFMPMAPSCKCPPPCDTYQYIKSKSTENMVPISTIRFVNRLGVTHTQEIYTYTFTALIVRCGGCIFFFSAVSVLWVLLKPILAMERILKQTIYGHLKNGLGKKTTLLKTLIVLSCLALFVYQVFLVVEGFINNKVIRRVETLDVLLAPRPAVMVCVEMPTFVRGERSDCEIQFSRDFITECKIDDEDCLADSGASFIWSRLFLVRVICDRISFKDVNTLNRLIIKLDKTAISHVYIFDEKIIPTFELFEPRIIKLDRIFSTTIKLAYDVKSVKRLPSCSENYNECLQRCWELHFLKIHNKHICLPTHMNLSVKYERCVNQNLEMEVDDFSYEHPIGTLDCDCPLPCTSSVFSMKRIMRQLQSDHIGNTLEVNLLPFSYTRETEEWRITYTDVVYQLGSLLGFVLGGSLFHFGILLLTKIRTFMEKFSLCKVSATMSALGLTWHLLAYGVFFHQVYLRSKFYAESPIHINEQLNLNTKYVFPEFTICMNKERISYIPLYGMKVYDTAESQYRVIDLSKGDYNFYFNYYPYSFDDYLIECKIFGVSCLNITGFLHEWKPVYHVNKYCSRLHIHPLYEGELLSMEIRFKYEMDFSVYLSSINEEAITDWQDTVGEATNVFKSNKLFYKYHAIRKELLRGKSRKCNDKDGYTRSMCWSQCLNNYTLETLHCYYPWKDAVAGLNVCNTTSDYVFTSSIPVSLLNNCNCSQPCSYTEHHMEIVDQENILNYYAEIVIEILAATKNVKDVWTYQSPVFLSDLGIITFVFTGLTVNIVLFKTLSLLRVYF